MTIVVLSLIIPAVCGFVASGIVGNKHISGMRTPIDARVGQLQWRTTTSLSMIPRNKLPPLETDEFMAKKKSFVEFLDNALAVAKPEHLPGLFVKNMELVISLNEEDGDRVITSVLEDAKAISKDQKATKDQGDRYNEVASMIDLVLGFTEDFVQEAFTMDDQNKKLLGKVIQAMRSHDSDTSSSNDSQSKEDRLDQILEEEKQNFTPGFLRHLEGECKRISNAPEPSDESRVLLETVRVIHARILEELGKDMGEAAQVLGQMMGYDNHDELAGVLEAGLQVRGRTFALEMIELTEEALDGFRNVVGGVDEELVNRVNFIHEKLKKFLNEHGNEFQ